jgi:hypothetical protein
MKNINSRLRTSGMAVMDRTCQKIIVFHKTQHRLQIFYKTGRFDCVWAAVYNEGLEMGG